MYNCPKITTTSKNSTKKGCPSKCNSSPLWDGCLPTSVFSSTDKNRIWGLAVHKAKPAFWAGSEMCCLEKVPTQQIVLLPTLVLKARDVIHRPHEAVALSMTGYQCTRDECSEQTLSPGVPLSFVRGHDQPCQQRDGPWSQGHRCWGSAHPSSLRWHSWRHPGTRRCRIPS